MKNDPNIYMLEDQVKAEIQIILAETLDIAQDDFPKDKRPGIYAVQPTAAVIALAAKAAAAVLISFERGYRLDEGVR